jgi:hypothetical protein
MFVRSGFQPVCRNVLVNVILAIVNSIELLTQNNNVVLPIQVAMIFKSYLGQIVRFVMYKCGGHILFLENSIYSPTGISETRFCGGGGVCVMKSGRR